MLGYLSYLVIEYSSNCVLEKGLVRKKMRHTGPY